MNVSLSDNYEIRNIIVIDVLMENNQMQSQKCKIVPQADICNKNLLAHNQYQQHTIDIKQYRWFWCCINRLSLLICVPSGIILV